MNLTHSHARPASDRKESVPPELLALAPLTPSAALERVHGRLCGLESWEVETRREQFGPNRVAHERPETLLAQLLKRLLNPLNILLLTLAAVSMFMGDRESAGMIFAMVVLSLTLALVLPAVDGDRARAAGIP